MFGEIDRRVPLKSRGRGVRLEANANQSIPNATMTVITFDTIIRDDYHTVDLTNFNDRIRITDEGWYIITANVAWTGNITGYRYIDLLINGGTITPAYITAGCAGGDGGPTLCLGCAYYFLRNDYLQLRGYQTSTISLNTFHYPPNSNLAICQLGA